MHTWLIVLIVSLLGLGPGLLEAGTTGEQPPEQKQLISGAADEATIRELQIRLPDTPQGEGAQ